MTRRQGTVLHLRLNIVVFDGVLIQLICRNLSFLGTLANLQKANINFVMYVRPSVGMQHFGSHWADFHEIWHLSIFKICPENSNFIKIWKGQRVLYMKLDTQFWTCLAEFILEWEIFQINLQRKSKHIFCSVTFFPPQKSCRLWVIVERGRSRITV